MTEWIVPAEKGLDEEEIVYLKEHGARELVRCEDCERGELIRDDGWYQCITGYAHKGDWFCADGRKKDG